MNIFYYLLHNKMGNKISRKKRKSLKYSKDISTPLPETMEAIRSPILNKLEEAMTNARQCTNLYNSIMNLYHAAKISTTSYQKRFLDDFISIHTEALTPDNYIQSLYTSSTYIHTTGTQQPTLPYLKEKVLNCSVDSELKSYKSLPAYVSGFNTDVKLLEIAKQTFTHIVNNINTINDLPEPTPEDVQHIVVRQIYQNSVYSYSRTPKHLDILEIATFATKKEAELVVDILQKIYKADDVDYNTIPITKTTDGFFTLYPKKADTEFDKSDTESNRSDTE